MKRFLTAFFSLAVLLSLTRPVVAQVPNQISYQGLLTTAGGTPVLDGQYKLQFDLYLTSTGGSPVWTEADSQIAVVRGTFSVILGTNTAFPDSFHRPLFVQVTALSGPSIGSPVVFSPRSALTSSPYALGLKTPVVLRDSTVGANDIRVINPASSAVGIRTEAVAGTGLLSYGSPSLSGIVGTTNYPIYYYSPNSGVNGYSVHGIGTLGLSDSGFAVLGYAIGNAPAAVYSYGKLIVNAPAGDTSVQLPSNSISSHEILDEPGIAQAVHPGSVYLSIGPALTNIDSVTITIPASGYILVEASCQVGLSGTWVSLQIDSLPNNALDLNHYFNVGFSSPPSGSSFLPAFVRRVYYRSAGTYTFYFEGELATPTSDYCWNSSISAIYFPKSYGPVSTVISPAEVSAFSKSAAVASVPGDQNQPSGGGYVVDLRELELAAANAREAAEHAERLLMEAKLNAIQTSRPK